MIPNLLKFNPDVIFISAGFDAHEKDLIHSDTDTKVTEFEFQWVTEQLNKVANQCCEGRIVSVLEGGYSTKSGPISPLAQSVAYHVRALVRSNKMHLTQGENKDEGEDIYIAEQRYERELLKKRRRDSEEPDPFTFMRVGLRKRQKT